MFDVIYLFTSESTKYILKICKDILCGKYIYIYLLNNNQIIYNQCFILYDLMITIPRIAIHTIYSFPILHVSWHVIKDVNP